MAACRRDIPETRRGTEVADMDMVNSRIVLIADMTEIWQGMKIVLGGRLLV